MDGGLVRMWVEGAGINYRRPFLPGKRTTTVIPGGLRGIGSMPWVSGLQQCLRPLLPLVGLNRAPWGGSNTTKGSGKACRELHV